MSGPGAPDLPDLPVVAALPALRSALASGTADAGADPSTRGRDASVRPGGAVLVAPPGAGKTTLVPLALLDEPWLAGRKILVLEPRRLATRAAARRTAELLGEPDAGGTVGYRVRMDTRVGPDTRIEVVTEGVLTRMLQSDPSLREVGLVVFDEFHERSLHADLGLALTLHARDLFRDDLRVLVMSATLDAVPVAELLGGAAVVETEGRVHEVETRWRERPIEGWIEPPAAAAVTEALERDEGDILVFLPGAGEIRRTAERLGAGSLPPEVTVHPLFGSLSRRDQDRAIAPSPPGRRKVVLATSIAETSLTIEGVRVVIDSGLMRVPRFDPGSGMTRLETVRVTRDSADQRRGRAGRTAPGVCYRMWTEGEDRGLVPHRRPEILEADLAPLAVETAAWGASPEELRWLDPPPRAAFAQANELLGELEILDPGGSITEHGERVAELGLHPRLAHMLIRGVEAGLGEVACDLAALLGERDILRAEGRAPDADLRLRQEAMERARSGRGSSRVGTVQGQRVAPGPLRRALREAAHWRRALAKMDGRTSGGTESDTAPAVGRVGALAALAYPDRIGRRREDARGRFLLRNGRGAYFAEPQSLAGEEWLVAVEVEGRGKEARIFRAAPLELADIERWFAGQIDEADEIRWDAEAGRVRAHRRLMLGALVLSEAPLAEPDPHAVAGALVEGIREAGLRVLPWTKETRQLRERMQFLHRREAGAPAGEDAKRAAADPGAESEGPEWPDTSEAALTDELDDWLRPFVAGMKSLGDLSRLDLSEALLARVGWDARERLDRLAPTHLDVPSGSRIPIDYSDPEAPALAVRLQEVFGMEATPAIAGGHVPVVMKLLSPARRPVQVTTDLASFWRDAYFEVRKDMRGRYPKHYWPENPLEAEPTRRTKPGR